MNLVRGWEAIIGLEIRVALNTKSKLFSCAPNHFGDPPNTNITPVCTGQPGALPVLNRAAVHKAVQLGCAINGNVALYSKFERRSHFSPTSPRNFQITQHDQPIVLGGAVTAEVCGEKKVFLIDRILLQEDTGMLTHFPSFEGVDYNRAGAPLLEIVSKPCMHTPQEAIAYGMALKQILQDIDISAGQMEEGSLRMDVNVSVRQRGEKSLRPKIKIKHVHSFSHMEMAIHAEVGRQIREYTQMAHLLPARVIQPAVYRWDLDAKETILIPIEEGIDAGLYFPEPDLLPLVLTGQYIADARKNISRALSKLS